MDTQLKDYVEIARSRITEQFKGSENLDRLMMMWLEGYEEIQQVILDLFDVLDIEQARGEQLDIIGAIVGQPREVVEVNVTGYFGFEGDNSAKSFGSVYNNGGGVYYSIYDPLTGSVVLSDNVYRTFIRAKIINNNAGGSPEDIIECAKQVFRTDYVELNEVGDTKITLNIGRRAWNDPQYNAFAGLDETDIAERLLPFPVGVTVEYIDTPSKSSPLGFVETWDAAADRLHETANVVLPANLNL